MKWELHLKILIIIFFNRKFYLDLMLGENIQSSIQTAASTVYNSYSAFKALRLLTKPYLVIPPENLE